MESSEIGAPIHSILHMNGPSSAGIPIPVQSHPCCYVLDEVENICAG